MAISLSVSRNVHRPQEKLEIPAINTPALMRVYRAGGINNSPGTRDAINGAVRVYAIEQWAENSGRLCDLEKALNQTTLWAKRKNVGRVVKIAQGRLGEMLRLEIRRAKKSLGIDTLIMTDSSEGLDALAKVSTLAAMNVRQRMEMISRRKVELKQFSAERSGEQFADFQIRVRKQGAIPAGTAKNRNDGDKKINRLIVALASVGVQASIKPTVSPDSRLVRFVESVLYELEDQTELPDTELLNVTRRLREKRRYLKNLAAYCSRDLKDSIMPSKNSR